MGFLNCRCGNRILDITDNLPFKAHFYVDQDGSKLWDDLPNEITTLVEAYHRGEFSAYWNKRFRTEPPDEPLGQLIADRLIEALLQTERHIYQCEACGRLLVQSRPGGSAPYVSFAPETNAKGILSRDGVSGE